MRILTVLTLSLSIGHAVAESKCPHDQGIYCPTVEAPRVTELKKGVVRLRYLVRSNGSVDNIEVVESTGDPRWIKAVMSKVLIWKYNSTDKAYEQEFEFSAVLGR